MFDKERYAVVVALLGMLGVENPAQIAPERAEGKLVTRLQKQGIPEGVNDAQRKLAEEVLGSSKPKSPEKPVENIKPETPTVKVPYRLTDGKDKDGPVEMMLPQMAEVRNKRRTDGKKWVEAPDAKPTHKLERKVKAAEDVRKKPFQSKRLVTGAVAKARARAEKPKASKPAPKAKPKTDKKTVKATTKGKSETKAPKPAKATKPKSDKPRKKGAGRKGGGAKVFRDILSDRKPHKKDDVVKAIVKTGVGEASARAYLVWAKRQTKETNPAKGGNPFGFVIVETLDKNLTKLIQKK